MLIVRHSNPSQLLLVLLLSLRTASSFQPAPISISSSRADACSTTSPIILGFSAPPPFPNDDDMNDDEPLIVIGQQSIPKLKLPTLSMPTFDVSIEEIGAKIGYLLATVIAFVVIQKVGLLVSGIVTPELSEEDIRNFKL
mmetsp:Transcript_5591/g.6499  ORF Transcript_5591/g.6499 Transcript_5591/m.6499 type:complete len:140 (-) Transcript_5591:224-643(-)